MFDYPSWAPRGTAKLTPNELSHVPKRACVRHQEITHNRLMHIKFLEDVIMFVIV